MSSKLRFSQHSPCDCMLFDGEKGFFYTLELKTVGSKSISFEREKTDKGIIHKYQVDSLLKFNRHKNVISGFILDFRESGFTYFCAISDFMTLISSIDKKSFNENDLDKYGNPITIKKKKLKINYKYYIDKLMGDLMEDKYENK